MTHYDATSPETTSNLAERLSDDPSVYFSSEVLELFDTDTTQTLLEAKQCFADVWQLNNECIAKMNESLDSLSTSNIGEHFNQYPKSFEVCKAFEALIKQRDTILEASKSHDRWRKLDKNAKAFYEQYSKSKNRFTPLSLEALNEDLMLLQQNASRMIELKQVLFELIESYDQAPDNKERLSILKQMAQAITNVSFSDSLIRDRLTLYLQGANAMGRCERLEQNTSDIDALVYRFGCEGTQAHSSDEPKESGDFKFYSPTELIAQTKSCRELNTSQVYDELGSFMERFCDLRDLFCITQAEHLAETVAQALKAAEDHIDSLLANSEISTDITEFPFTLIDENNDNATKLAELGVLTTFTKEFLLQPIRREIDAFLTTIPIITSLDYQSKLYGLRQEAGEKPHAVALTEARQNVLPMLERYIIDLRADLQPAIDVFIGRKPRAKKRRGSVSSKQIQESELYDTLHAAGFPSQEKSVGTAILTGQWPEIEALHERAQTVYQQVSEFIALFGIEDILTNSTLELVAQTSFTPAFQSLKKHLNQSGTGLTTVLSAHQITQLRKVVDTHIILKLDPNENK